MLDMSELSRITGLYRVPHQFQGSGATGGLSQVIQFSGRSDDSQGVHVL